MSPDRVGLWRKGGVVLGRIYTIEREDLDAVRGHLKVGGLVLPFQLCGDCIYRYKVVEKDRRSAFRLCTGKLLECRPIGVPYECQPTDTEYQRLLSGDATKFSYVFDISAELKEAVRQTLLDLERSVACAERMVRERAYE